MRRALLLSSAELPARGHEQINRDVTQLPYSPAPSEHKGGKVMLRGGHKEQNSQQGKGCDPCEVPLVMPNLQNFIISAPVCLIIRKLSSHLPWVSVVCVYVCDARWGWGVWACRHPLSDYLQALFADLYRPTTTPSIICSASSLFRPPHVPPHHYWTNITLSCVCSGMHCTKTEVISSPET